MRNLGHKEVSLMPKVAYPLKNRASILAFQVVLVVKNLPANAREARNSSLISRSGRSPGAGSGSPLQYSCLENSVGR